MILHSQLLERQADYQKYRLTLEGGRRYVNTYLAPLSERETTESLQLRKDKMYCPNHATAAVREIGDSLHQRLVDVTRIGGSKAYQEAIMSDVDGLGRSMSLYMGLEVIDELLPMGKVGVLVDAPREVGRGTVRPYLTTYPVEMICDWYPCYPTQEGYEYLLLQETIERLENGIVQYATVYRKYELTDNGVIVSFMDINGVIFDVVETKLQKIPFHVFEIATPLLKDISDIQIALMNLEASELHYLAQANFPIFYEYYDPAKEGAGVKTSAAQTDGTKEVVVGLSRGRRIPKGLEPPSFIAPPATSMNVSMEKSKTLKDDIRRILRLNLNTATNTSRLSADSRKMDMSTLESQLAGIGQVLCDGENTIAGLWAAYEGNSEAATITYPSVYEIKPDEQRYAEAKELLDLSDKISSPTAKQKILETIVFKLFRGKIPEADISKITKEIRTNKLSGYSINDLVTLYKEGIVDSDLVESYLSLPEDTVERGQTEKQERIQATLAAQGGAAAVMNIQNNGRPPREEENVRESE